MRSILKFFLMPLSALTCFGRGSFNICPKYRLDKCDDTSLSPVKASLCGVVLDQILNWNQKVDVLEGIHVFSQLLKKVWFYAWVVKLKGLFLFMWQSKKINGNEQTLNRYPCSHESSSSQPISVRPPSIPLRLVQSRWASSLASKYLKRVFAAVTNRYKFTRNSISPEKAGRWTVCLQSCLYLLSPTHTLVVHFIT